MLNKIKIKVKKEKLLKKVKKLFKKKAKRQKIINDFIHIFTNNLDIYIYIYIYVQAEKRGGNKWGALLFICKIYQ